MKIFTVLAHDPGTRNYGYAIIKGVRFKNRLRFKVIENGKIKHTIDQMKSRRRREKHREAYLNEIKFFIEKHNPTVQIAERYMTRGIKGLLVECVNYMLGGLESRTDVPLVLVPAVTWKQELKRCGFDLKAAYKKSRTTPHQVDAGMMGVFALMKLTKSPRQKFPMRKYLKNLEKTSTEKLKRKRNA